MTLILGIGLSQDAIAFTEAILEVEVAQLDISWIPGAFEVLSSPGAGEDEMLFTVAQNCHHYARALRNPHTPPEFFPAKFRQAVFSLDAEYAIAAHGSRS